MIDHPIDLEAVRVHLDIDRLNRDLVDYRDQIARLRTALEVAHKDTQRLDFMDVNARKEGMFSEGDNLRAIVDHAMADANKGEYQR